MTYKNLIEYLPDFMDAFEGQLAKDDARWGDTWRQRPLEGQELRAKARFDDYFYQFENDGTPIPWLKVMGEAFIAWVRERENETKV